MSTVRSDTTGRNCVAMYRVTWNIVSHMSEMLHVRLRPEERKLYELAAKADKRRLSDWVRLVLLAAVKERVDEPELINAADKAVVR